MSPKRGGVDVFFIVRLVVAAAFIYYGVWRESKIALTVMFGLTFFAVEIMATAFAALIADVATVVKRR